MKSQDTVTFLTDFGWGGGYVAACEATIVRVHPSARVLHISHEVPVGDVGTGALVLARVAPLYPVAVHLAVVDPGVGTARRPLALSASRGDWLVGPDNGLLVDAGGVARRNRRSMGSQHGEGPRAGGFSAGETLGHVPWA